MFRSVSQEKLSVVSSFMNLPWGDLKKKNNTNPPHTHKILWVSPCSVDAERLEEDTCLVHAC